MRIGLVCQKACPNILIMRKEEPCNWALLMSRHDYRRCFLPDKMQRATFAAAVIARSTWQIRLAFTAVGFLRGRDGSCDFAGRKYPRGDRRDDENNFRSHDPFSSLVCSVAGRWSLAEQPFESPFALDDFSDIFDRNSKDAVNFLPWRTFSKISRSVFHIASKDTTNRFFQCGCFNTIANIVLPAFNRLDFKYWHRRYAIIVNVAKSTTTRPGIASSLA
jgi:hypothetical protein